MCNKNICRLCLKAPSKTINIFSSDISFLIETLTSIKVDEDDGLPTLSCQSCISDVRTAYGIRNRIIESDRRLRNNIAHSLESEIDIKEEFDNEKITEENIDYSSQDTEDISSTRNLDCSNIKDEPSDEEDDTIYKLIKSIEDDGLEDSCEDIEKETIETKPKLEKNVEIKKKIDENLDFSDDEEANDKEERVVSSTGSDSKEHLEDISGDYAIYPEAAEIIHVDTSGDTRKYTCILCNIELKPRGVHTHKCKHIKAKCNTCGLITRLDNARRHLLTHKTDTRVCHICGSSHKSLEGLRSHMYYFHKNRVLYKCQHCSEEFRNRTHMVVHIRRYHTGDRPYQCDACGKAFVTSGCLKKHKQLVHQVMRRFPCEYCKKAFSSHGALTTHKRQHTGELPYTCDLCHNGFRQLVSLRTHMKSKHNVIMKPNKPGFTYTNQAKNDMKKQRM